MYYTLLIIGFIVIITVICRFLSFSSEPDFSLYSVLSEEGLVNRICNLATEGRFYYLGGKGLSIRTMESYTKKGYKILSQKPSEALSEFEKWLFDNYYKVEEALSRQKKFLPRYKKLPHIKGLPRIYTFASAIVKNTDGGFTRNDIIKLAEVYNASTPLTFFEILSFRSALEYALLEYITIFYAKSIVINEKYRAAEKDIAKKKFNIAAIRYNSYLYRINLCDDVEFKYAIDNICKTNGKSLEERADAFLRLCAYYNGCVGAAIGNLHKIVELDDECILNLSALNSLLKVYPLYEKDTLATRYALCYGIAQKAKKLHKSELFYARQLLDKAEVNGDNIEKEILVKQKGKNSQRAFIALILTLSSVLSTAGAFFIGNYYLIPVLFPIAFGVIKFIQSEIFAFYHRPTYLPRLKIDAERKTLITVTQLVKDAKEVEEAFRHLMILRAANGNKLFGYSLLLDLSDSASAESESDSDIIDRIEKCYSELSDKSNINVFLRTRVLCKDGKYRGWEKKRGALLQLNEYLIDRKEKPFRRILGETFTADYVITLDCDTFINCADELVRIMEHPANSKINILGLKMRIFPDSVSESVFSYLMSGATGLDPYGIGSAAVEYDVFGQGNYTGKGIYRVKNFHNKVSNIFRDERILSHDFIEGAVAGCAECGECGLEDFPNNFSKYLARELRWLRGDWQLLPFLFSKIKNRDGEKIKNPVSPIGKYHIFSNMIYGLMPIAQIILLIVSVFIPKALIAAFILNLLYIFNSFRLTTLKSFGYALKEFVRQIYSVSLLPTVAVMNFGAILITIARIMRGRNLLAWKTSAHFNGKINTLPNIIAAVGFFIAGYFVNIFFAVTAFIFIFGIILNILLSFGFKRKKILLKDNDLIKSLAYKTWRYFSENLTKENNFLIPDNINEKTDKVAYRTSPTNIGFSLVAVACAYELNFIDFEIFEQFISDITNSLEKITKWRGHIYNWIDIKTMEPLEPRYVSVIDSGNLLACLLAVKNYFDGALKERLEKLIEDMDFDVFMDKRGLLKIGYNDTLKSFDRNYYDLLGSESMLTYLCAIGCGKIDRVTWNNLSKQCVRFKGDTLFSWTGGMFEYLMTPLFFDFYPGSFLYRSAENAVRAQIFYSKKKRLPYWGISECQYNDFDEWGNYQYKAFGVPQIALSEFSDPKNIAPYASVLAYKFAPEETIKNLKKLYEEKTVGYYGFYEAIDDDAIIKSFMAHHQGMILFALTRLLKNNAVIEKFSMNPEIGAANMLLSNFDVVNARRKKRYPLRKNFEDTTYKCRGISRTPYWRFYTNKRYSLACNERGENYSCFENFAVDTGGEYGDRIEILYKDKQYNLLSAQNVVYDRHNIKYFLNNGDIDAKVQISILSGCNGDVRKIELRNIGTEVLKCKLKYSKKLCLCPYEDYMSHPAFVGLNIETFFDDKLGYLYAKKKNTPLYFAHFTDDERSEYNCNGLSERTENEKRFGFVLYPISQSTTSFELNSGESIELNLFNIVSYDKEFFSHIIPLLKSDSFGSVMTCSNYALNGSFALDKDLAEIASKIMAGCKLPDEELSEYFDISLPIITETVSFEFELTILKKHLKEISLLYQMRVRFNFCLIVSDSVRTKADKLLELTDFASSVRYGKFRIIALEDSSLVKKILINSVKHDISAFETIRADAIYNVINRDNSTNSATFPLGIGGFNEKFEYILPYRTTPKPWSNVLADDGIGSVVTESGGGFTFAENSRQQKLTEFDNDVVFDVPSEKLFLYDATTGNFRSLTPKPCGAGTQRIEFGFGYCRFVCKFNDVDSTLTEFTSRKNKYFVLDIKSEARKKFKVIFACDLVLGDFTEYNISALTTSETDCGLVVANCLNGLNAYISCNTRVISVKMGDITAIKEFPLKCNDNFWFKNNTAALIAEIETDKGENKIVFSLGTELPDFDIDKLFSEVQMKYENLTMVGIKCGIPEIDAMLKWLPYQTYNSRFCAKTGFYQVSGAIGFRDQLQDCLTVLYIDPDEVKKHILLCASRQYESGDVQHWWHASENVGVRTLFCDDRLFLPYLTAEYINFTGDKNILSSRVPYLKNISIPQGKSDIYHSAICSDVCETLEEHCLNCIYSENLTADGVLKIKGGDWFDAMDKMGVKGRGTTTWGTMFLFYVIDEFLPYVSSKHDRTKLIDLRNSLLDGINKCWEKDRFIRGVCDNGMILGSETSTECKLDIVTQSWAFICGGVDEQKALKALETAESLVDRTDGIVKLLSPPFESTVNAGYISNYPPGIRENGGQYTHAAVWYIISLILSGNCTKAYDLLRMINPINHSRNLKDVLKYKSEPYVLCGDVYSGEHGGEGGWSWYTGAASWLYVCLVKYFFGIDIRDDIIRFEPNLPDKIEKVEIEFSTTFGVLPVTIDNTVKEGKWRIFINKRAYSEATLKLNPELADKKIVVMRG